MNAEQLHILQHALGCDQYGRYERRGPDEGDGCMGYYRNRYVSQPTPHLTQLVACGYLKSWGKMEMAGGDHLYTVTLNGERAMREQSPKPPKRSKSAERYQDFLNADCGLRFGEWLKARHGKRNPPLPQRNNE